MLPGTRLPSGVLHSTDATYLVLLIREWNVWVGALTRGEVATGALEGGWGLSVNTNCTTEGQEVGGAASTAWAGRKSNILACILIPAQACHATEAACSNSDKPCPITCLQVRPAGVAAVTVPLVWLLARASATSGLGRAGGAGLGGGGGLGLGGGVGGDGTGTAQPAGSA